MSIGYYIDMNEFYAHRQPSSYIEKEQSRDILNDLTTIMKTKKDRRIMEEGYKVYKTQPKTLKREKPPQSSPLEQQLKKRIRELEIREEIREEIRKGKGAERVVRNQVKPSDERPRSKGMSNNNIEDTPPSPFKHPCHKCEDKPGTDREKKDYCTNKHHCRIHDG